jgi:NADH-quinone oxidoreductase subunit M
LFICIKSGKLFIEDLYKLTATEQYGYSGFLLAYAIKIPLIPFHTWQTNVYKRHQLLAPCSGIMLKMGLYSVIGTVAPLAAKEYMYIFIGLGIAGVIYGSIVALKQKI